MFTSPIAIGLGLALLIFLFGWLITSLEVETFDDLNEQ